MTPPATPSPAVAASGKPDDETNPAVVKESPHSAGIIIGLFGPVTANAPAVEVAKAIATVNKNAKYLYISPPLNTISYWLLCSW